VTTAAAARNHQRANLVSKRAVNAQRRNNQRAIAREGVNVIRADFGSRERASRGD
jgi:hypothetical protein